MAARIRNQRVMKSAGNISARHQWQQLSVAASRDGGSKMASSIMA